MFIEKKAPSSIPSPLFKAKGKSEKAKVKRQKDKVKRIKVKG
jgi:hypothetical protein